MWVHSGASRNWARTDAQSSGRSAGGAGSGEGAALASVGRSKPSAPTARPDPRTKSRRVSTGPPLPPWLVLAEREERDRQTVALEASPLLARAGAHLLDD